MNLVKIILTLFSMFIIITSCSTKIEKQEVKEDFVVDSLLRCCPDGGGLFKEPINIGRKSSIVKNDLNNYMRYEVRTDSGEVYKDHSPFVEINRGNNSKERLWFTTSRTFPGEIISTELPQKLHYTDRTLKEDGLCPSENWGPIQEFKTNIDLFDKLVTGAVTIAGDTMILSASHIENLNPIKYNNHNDLYMLVRNKKGEFNFEDKDTLQNNVIKVLCSNSTWESQPTLSTDGNHLFFVSNRPSKLGDRPADMNIYYATKNERNEWDSAKVFVFNSKFNEESPQISPDGKYLYFATDNPAYATKGGFDIVAVEFESILKDGEFRHIIGNKFVGEPKLAEEIMPKGCDTFSISINDKYNQRYPHLYYNPANKLNAGKAIFWSSDNPQGYGGYDIYGCAIHNPCIELEIYVLDACTFEKVDNAVVSIDKNALEITTSDRNAVKKYRLNYNENYTVKGGSSTYGSAQINGKVYTKWLEPKILTDFNQILYKSNSKKIETLSIEGKEFYNIWESKLGTIESRKIDSSFVTINGFQRISIKETITSYGKEEIIKDKKYMFDKIIETNETVYGVVASETSSNSTECNYLNCHDEFTNQLKVEGATVLSEKSRNNLLATPAFLADVLTIRDTVFLTKCEKPISVKLIVDIFDKCQDKDDVVEPIFKLVEVESGREVNPTISEKATQVSYSLDLNKEYKVYGGSTFSSFKTNWYQNMIFKGYVDIYNQSCPADPNLIIINGAVVKSEKTRNGVISTKGISGYKTFYDTVYVAKSLINAVDCSCFSIDFLEHKNLAWFQTAFWELNLPEYLPIHLKDLNKGFDSVAMYNSMQGISGKNYVDNNFFRKQSDYQDNYYSKTMFDLIENDGYNYSIANGRWIELHPNNMNWGVRPTNSDAVNKKRFLELRPERVKQYFEFAGKAEENLSLMVKVITENYLPMLDSLKKWLPDIYPDVKIMIQVNALSDLRAVDRGWYIGDKDINYVSSYYDDRYGKIQFNEILIKKPNVDEEKKKIKSKTDLGKTNIVLSDLRAYFGYKEVLKRLSENSAFKNNYLNRNLVFLPEVDNKVELKDSKILILTKGYGDDEDVLLTKPYPYMANPGRTGYYDLDEYRRIELNISLVGLNGDNVIKLDICKEFGKDCEKYQPIIRSVPVPTQEKHKSLHGIDVKRTNKSVMQEFIDTEEKQRERERVLNKRNAIKINPSLNKPSDEKPILNQKPSIKNKDVSNSSSADNSKPIEPESIKNKQVQSESKTEQKITAIIPEKTDNKTIENNKSTFDLEDNDNYSIVFTLSDSQSEAINIITKLKLKKIEDVKWNEFIGPDGKKYFKVGIFNIKTKQEAEIILKKVSAQVKDLGIIPEIIK